MRFSEFKQILSETGEYKTGDTVRPFGFWRFFGRSNLLFYTALFVYTLLGGFYGVIGILTFERWQWISYRMIRVFETAGAKFELSGFTNVTGRDKPCVFVSNHMSMAETYLLPCMLLIGGDMTVVVKQSLMKYPGLGRILKTVFAIPVRRESARDDLKAILEGGRDRIQRDISVLIFPQSTRTTSFIKREFNSVGTKLAVRNGVDLVPIAIKTDFQGIGKVFRDYGPLNRKLPILVRVGKPISTTQGLSEKEVQAAASTFIAETFSSWGGSVLES